MIDFKSTMPFVSGLDPRDLEAQRQVNHLLAQMPHPDVRTPEGLAMLRGATAPPQAAPVLKPTDVSILGPGGALRLHVFAPEGPARAVFIRIHGGGWAAGAPEDDEALNDQIARECDVAIVSPAYRLAPEVSVREQIDDCVAAARWAANESEKRFRTSRLMIGGNSAGAHLAAATLLHLRDAGDAAFTQMVAAHLDCGAYDLSKTPSARAATDATLVLNRTWIDGLFDLALGGIDSEGRRAPSLSPLYADLSRLPPALFMVGALDPLLDDSLFMAARWRAAGNRAELDVWPEGGHAFANMGTPLSSHAFRRTAAFITESVRQERP